MILKQRWSCGYYNQVMSILGYIMSSDKCADEKTFVNSREAAKAFNDIESYAFVHKYDFNYTDFTIRISITDEALRTVDRAIGYAFGGGFYPDFEPIGKFIKDYAKDVLKRSKEYVEEYKNEQEKLEVDILVCIKKYLADCDANGIKPVKKQLVTDEHSYGKVLEVWRKYEQGEYETKSKE